MGSRSLNSAIDEMILIKHFKELDLEFLKS